MAERKVSYKDWPEERKNKAREASRRSRKKHLAKRDAYRKSYEKDNKEKVHRLRRAWYLKNKKICDARTRAWQGRNKEHIRNYNREWTRQQRKTESLEARQLNARKKLEAYTIRTYGKTLADYDSVLYKQDGHCALCPRTPEQEHRKRLNWDHCHQSNEVRGLLCTPCNHALGVLGDSAEGLERALAYIKGEHNLHSP